MSSNLFYICGEVTKECDKKLLDVVHLNHSNQIRLSDKCSSAGISLKKKTHFQLFYRSLGVCCTVSVYSSKSRTQLPAKMNQFNSIAPHAATKISMLPHLSIVCRRFLTQPVFGVLICHLICRLASRDGKSTPTPS